MPRSSSGVASVRDAHPYADLRRTLDSASASPSALEGPPERASTSGAARVDAGIEASSPGRASGAPGRGTLPPSGAGAQTPARIALGQGVTGEPREIPRLRRFARDTPWRPRRARGEVIHDGDGGKPVDNPVAPGSMGEGYPQGRSGATSGGRRAAGAAGGRDGVIDGFSPAVQGTLSPGNSLGIMGLFKADCGCPQRWGRASKKTTVKFLSSNRLEDDATPEKRARTP